MNLKLENIRTPLAQVTGASENGHIHCLPYDGTDYNLTIPNGRKKEPITYSPNHADEVAIRATMGFKSPHVYYQHRPSTTSLHWQLPSHLFDRNHGIIRANIYKSTSAPNPQPSPGNKQILITTKSELHKHFRVNFGGDR